MRSIALVIALAGCDVLFRVDAVVPVDGPARALAFVQNITGRCVPGDTCASTLAPAIDAGNRVLVVVTYQNQAASGVSIVDDAGSTYTQEISAVNWTSDYQTELWSAVAAGTVHQITIDVTTSQSAVEWYIDEYTPSVIDQLARNAGMPSDITIATDSRVVAHPNEIVFGHAEAFNATVSTGSGFTTRSKQNGNIEEDTLATAPGDYSATFMLDQPGAWVALMVVLQ